MALSHSITALLITCMLLAGAATAQTERAKLEPPKDDQVHFGAFGRAVAVHGDFAICGMPNGNGLVAGEGSAFIYGRDEGGTDNWGEITKVFASDGVAGNDFGYGVAIGGDTAVVGAPSIPVHGDGDGNGAAYIYVRDTGTGDWTEEQKLIPSGGVVDDAFGERLAIVGNTIFVAAPRADDRGTDAGAVYVFVEDLFVPGEWGLLKKVLPEFGNALAQFGQAIDAHGDLLIVGSNNGGSLGKASIFSRNQGGANNWGLVTDVTASDFESFEDYGRSVGIEGTTAIVGAYRGDGVVDGAGAAYIYEQDLGGPSNWGEAAKLIADDGAAGDFFGISVAIEDDLALVGASENNTPFADAGSMYLYTRDAGGAGNWGQTRQLLTCDNPAGANFGFSMDIQGGTAVVGEVDYVIVGVARTGRATVFDDMHTGGSITDCNNNGIADECEIASGAALDANTNGIPDECEAIIDTGNTALISPTGGAPTPTASPLINVTNVSGGAGETVTVSITDEDLHPGASGYSVFGLNASIETSMADGAFFMTITLPFDAADLGGADWSTIDLTYFNPASSAWELAVAANTANSPGHASPVGDRHVQSSAVSFTLADLSTDLGDYGVFWNRSTMQGFVWANVDHTTDYAAGLDESCPADLNVDNVVNVLDLLAMLGAWGPNPGHAADLNGDDTVNVLDLLIMLGDWGPCG